jgi:hypothetical protein
VKLFGVPTALETMTVFYALRFSLFNSSCSFLDALAKLRTVVVCFLMWVRRTVCMDQLGAHWMYFMKFDIWLIFASLSRTFRFHWYIKIVSDTYMKNNTHFFLSALLRARVILYKSCRENQNTNFMFNNFFFPSQISPLSDNVEKYGRAGLVTDEYGACALHVGYLRL